KSFWRKSMKRFLLCIPLLLLMQLSCKEDPPVVPPDPPERISNTIILSTDWSDFNRINLKWNSSSEDTLNNFVYKLFRKGEGEGEIHIASFYNA
ncbi:MAG TPA: hypothetical protein VFQ59_00005, partial [Candidatus Paceibacterota bacterium]|nr:hypothetical protein [Candidatus Paceibacterota bacterium]